MISQNQGKCFIWNMLNFRWNTVGHRYDSIDLWHNVWQGYCPGVIKFLLPARISYDWYSTLICMYIIWRVLLTCRHVGKCYYNSYITCTGSLLKFWTDVRSVKFRMVRTSHYQRVGKVKIRVHCSYDCLTMLERTNSIFLLQWHVY